MSKVIKTGFLIDGVEVTSEHIGKKIKVTKSNDNRWLPVDFITTITGVSSDNTIDLQDTGGKESSYVVPTTDDCWEFKWITHPKPKKSSTKHQRQKIAKDIREAKTALDILIKESEEVGMVVNLSEDGIKITFNPPPEEY